MDRALENPPNAESQTRDPIEMDPSRDAAVVTTSNTHTGPALINMGIFSFLDTVLARLPASRTSMRSSNVRSSPHSLRQVTLRVQELPSNEDASESSSMDFSSSSERMNTEPVEAPPVDDVEAGGFRESMFLYLSEKEKEEFSCCICYLILNKVYQCKNKHQFCHGCIYTWSCGSGTGHDKCPMCRIDGLYALNTKVNDKILQKCVTCEADGCNWLGCLRDYEKHEHRYYTPSEFQVLNTFRRKTTPPYSSQNQKQKNYFANAPVSIDSEDFMNSRFSFQNTVQGLNSRNSPNNRPTRILRNRPQIQSPQPDEQVESNENEDSELVYKRLVPSNWHAAYDQLRETREQLAAMLTLMTIELEERRNSGFSQAHRSAQTLPPMLSRLNNSSEAASRFPHPGFVRRLSQEQAPDRQSLLLSMSSPTPPPNMPVPMPRFSGILADMTSPSMQRARSNLMNDLYEQVGATSRRRRPNPLELTPRGQAPLRLEPLRISSTSENEPMERLGSLNGNIRQAQLVDLHCLRDNTTTVGSTDSRQEDYSDSEADEDSESSELDSDDMTVATDLMENYSQTGEAE